MVAQCMVAWCKRQQAITLIWNVPVTWLHAGSALALLLIPVLSKLYSMGLADAGDSG